MSLRSKQTSARKMMKDTTATCGPGGAEAKRVESQNQSRGREPSRRRPGAASVPAPCNDQAFFR